MYSEISCLQSFIGSCSVCPFCVPVHLYGLNPARNPAPHPKNQVSIANLYQRLLRASISSYFTNAVFLNLFHYMITKWTQIPSKNWIQTNGWRVKGNKWRISREWGSEGSAREIIICCQQIIISLADWLWLSRQIADTYCGQWQNKRKKWHPKAAVQR